MSHALSKVNSAHSRLCDFTKFAVYGMCISVVSQHSFVTKTCQTSLVSPWPLRVASRLSVRDISPVDILIIQSPRTFAHNKYSKS